MSTLQLSSSQKRILTSLVNLSDGDGAVVRGRDIADAIDRNPGTVRNQMQSLRALQLVEGVPGPKGGYKPTVNAYETLDIERMDDPAEVPVEREGTPVPGVNVEGIDLASVHNPDLCRVEIVVRGSLHEFSEGDRIVVGPTPTVKLRIVGVVDGVNPMENTLVVRARSMQAPTEPGSGGGRLGSAAD
ncbi:TrmB family transcriptional regulator [Halorubrum sp. JWXQ-INN 858]|uniref:Rrf2 family transcriptional regulator n=1 Tax=Halorubrum sp. JWXQ-INN 858 TaxID=2690782 RepID=UPI00135CE318|nr:Rrf2 family transcriptional regulator [Halorubrum sp. JWXQ-INN 858]MWV64808.1 TrmB family transcriptional regulator [Halorubrum sp. JWXQ-INN 858]